MQRLHGVHGALLYSQVLLFILTVCLLILIVGPVILTVFFLILPAGDGGGPRGSRFGICYLGGVFSYSPISGAGAREGGHGGADLGLATWTVFLFILLARGRCFLGRGQQGGWGAGWCAWLFR